MGRQRKGRAVSGWVIVDKPAGIGSTTIVNKIRWAFQAQKAGHAGTLDPDATGLLAVALGEATKAIPYVMDALKSYEFTATWGASTTTDDAAGSVVETRDTRPTEDEIKAALPRYLGEIMQVPPAYSAVKVDGERAYDLAREGEELDLKARPLWMEELVLTDILDRDTATFEMVCGKGGYVRSIARDLGRDLGCLAHVKTLRRLWSGPFDLQGAVTLEQIEALARTEAIDSLLRPIEDGLTDLPEVRLNETFVGKVRNGNHAPAVAQEAIEYDGECWASFNGEVVALGHYRGADFHPARVIVKG